MHRSNRCRHGIQWCEALRYCQENSIDAYIPNIGSYKSTREGFIYDKGNDRYICIHGNEVILLFGHQIEIKMYDKQCAMVFAMMPSMMLPGKS